jgi:signal transduction histidine kinase
MPPEFSHLGLDEILGYYIKDVVGNGGVEMTFTTDNTQPVGSVPEKIAYEVYRIAQELLSNIVKHSQATKADITLRTISPGRHCLEIKDNGLEWDGNSKTIGAGTQTLLDRAASIRAVIKFSRKDNLNLKSIIFNS